MKRTPLTRKSPMKRAGELAVRATMPKRKAVTADERRTRKIIAERSQGVCEICGHNRATNAHHRKNASQGGEWCPSNLLHICGSGTTGDHGYVTEHPEEARLMGWSVSAYQDPAEVSVWLFGRGRCFLFADGSTSPAEDVA